MRYRFRQWVDTRDISWLEYANAPGLWGVALLTAISYVGGIGAWMDISIWDISVHLMPFIVACVIGLSIYSYSGKLGVYRAWAVDLIGIWWLNLGMWGFAYRVISEEEGVLLTGTVLSLCFLISSIHAWGSGTTFRYPFASLVLLCASVGGLREFSLSVLPAFPVWVLLGTIEQRVVAAKQVIWASKTVEQARVFRDYTRNVMATGHECRNLLTVVQGRVDIMEKSFSREMLVENKDFNVLKKDIGGVIDVIDSFGEMSLDTQTLAVDLSQEVTNISQSLGQRYPHVAWKIGKAPTGINVRVFGGAVSVRQVVANVIMNACQGDGNKGAGAVMIRMPRDSGPHQRVVIEDDGPGLPQDLLHHGPRMFFSRKHGGKGLGLVIVQSLMEAGGGGVTFSNREEGGGASVTLSFRKVQ